MTIDRMILAIAGCFILISTLLSAVHHPNWLWFTAFVGANLLQSAFTGFCPMTVLLKKVGLKTGQAFDGLPAAGYDCTVSGRLNRF